MQNDLKGLKSKKSYGFAKSGLMGFALLSLGACGIFGSNSNSNIAPMTANLGVNGYLWQASLDTLSFMPITAADPSAAIILTDWYSLTESPNERVKVSIRFLSEQLRSDGLQVTVIRQEKQQNDWITLPTQATTVLKIEEAILTEARKLRVKRFG